MTDDFMIRAINRMHECGMIDAAARDRLLEPPLPTHGDPHQAIGFLQALLAVALWPINDAVGRSSVGDAMRDIAERGIDAHAEDLERETKPRRSRR